MNGWHSAEQQAQINYGREQLANDGISDRPIGYTGPHYGSSVGYDRQKPRQYGERFPFIDRRNQYGERHHVSPTQERERGHMAFLKSLQRSGSKIRLVTILEETVVGYLKDCDETTITVKIPKPTPTNPDAYLNRTFIKHNLIEFAPIVEGVTFS